MPSEVVASFFGVRKEGNAYLLELSDFSLAY